MITPITEKELERTNRGQCLNDIDFYLLVLRENGITGLKDCLEWIQKVQNNPNACIKCIWPKQE